MARTNDSSPLDNSVPLDDSAQTIDSEDRADSASSGVSDAGPHADAQREGAAIRKLREAGADGLEARPWRPAPAPPSAVDLAQYALWRTSAGEADRTTLLSGLALLTAARAEVEGLEAGLLFSARSAGLTWAQIADAMGFRSPQACQQRFARLTGRAEGRS